MPAIERRWTRQLTALPLLTLTIICCQHPAPSTSNTSNEQSRLLHPEQLITPPEGADWPREINNGQYPHYPKDARRNGVEAYVLAAFVISEDGRPEPRTISILQSPRGYPDFASSVCTFLRNGAQYSWETQAPARVLVVMPFIFQLTGVTVTQALAPEPDLRPVRDSVRQMSPTELAAWIESKKHCS
jgi:hypothetical protein